MRFAILHPCPECLLLARDAEKSGHEVIAIYGDPAEHDSDTVQSMIASAGWSEKQSRAWEQLLHDPVCQVLLIGAGSILDDSELRSDQLRKIAQSGMPLIVTHPTAGMLMGFELQMIQKDSKSPIVPYTSLLGHPAIISMGKTCAAGGEESRTSALGNVQQIVMERELTSGSKAAVLDAFARDALVLRRLAGRIDRLSALSSQPYPATDWANLSVQMTSQDGTIVRWSAGAGNSTAARISIVGDEGRATSTVSSERERWSDEAAQLEGFQASIRPLDVDWPFQIIQHSYDDLDTTADQLWDDACRANELADTVEASCRRNKTIELYHEEHTEEETFKGMMAAGGCLALLATLFLFPLFVVLDSLDLPILENPPIAALHLKNWPAYLLIGLLCFLSLQFLRIVFWRSDRKA